MAGTYKLIQAQTLSSSQSSVTFSSIPATYTDLVLRVSARTDNPGVNNESCYIQFNSDTATNYSYVLISGNGSAASSNIYSSQTYIGSITADSTTATANTFASWEIYVPSYLASQNKPISVISMQENNQTATFIRPNAGLWRNTAAITSITFTGVSGVSSFVTGSSFYLYGIEIPAQQITPKATGGDITYDGSYIYHTFRQSGTFTPTQSLTAQVLVVAGGGGAANAGGGAGGISYHSGKSLTATGYTVTVGAGGAGAPVNNNSTSGSNSVFSDIISNGGGADLAGTAVSGGSGSGSYAPPALGAASNQGNTGGATGYGNSGGNAISNQGGGGGGAGAAGGNGGPGGAGLNTWASWATATVTGVSGYYAGGGGTYNFGNASTTVGGAGGGGNGGGGNGTVNTGGGAGSGTTGGTGGSGIVIVRYAI